MVIRAEIQDILSQIRNGSIVEVNLDSQTLYAVDDQSKLMQEGEVAALADALVSPDSKVTYLSLFGNKEVTIAKKNSRSA